MKRRLRYGAAIILLVLLANCGLHLFTTNWPIRTQLLMIYGIQVPVAILGSLLFVRVVTKLYRLEKKLCVNCGYDLRATPDRCPECGTVPAAK